VKNEEIIDELNFMLNLFATYEIPKEKKFLYKYFTGDATKMALKYLYCFGNLDNFAQNTGININSNYLSVIKNKVYKLLAIHQIAKENMDIDMIVKIESGELKMKELEKCPSLLTSQDLKNI
jgi:hypothetical protein